MKRLKGLSSRIILAFDGDEAGEKAGEKSAILGLSLGMEVKIASLPEGQDPADLVKESPDKWKEVLRGSVHAVEYALDKIFREEKDPRKRGKLIEKKVLPMLLLVGSSMERSHFISLISKRSGIKEEVIWDDLKKTKPINTETPYSNPDLGTEVPLEKELSKRERIEERLKEVLLWQTEIGGEGKDGELLVRERSELEHRLQIVSLEEELTSLQERLHRGEEVMEDINKTSQRLDEEKRKIR